MSIDISKLDEFTQGYIDCALKMSVDNQGVSLEGAEADLADETIEAMSADCADFQQRYAALLNIASRMRKLDNPHGYDFWLTRNMDVSGFRDRGYPARIGEALTKAAQAYGSYDLYVGDTGNIYGS